MKLSDIDKLDLAALAEEHPDFDQLINEDALLNLSYDQKRVFRGFYAGASDRELSDQTGLAIGTIIGMRRGFWARARSSVVFALLAREMAKGMPPKRTNRRSMTEGEMLPVIDDDGIVIDFARDKYALHQPGDKALRHTSVIVLVAQLDRASDELSFFVADKAAKMMTVNEGASSLHAWETVGGLVERQDSARIVPGQPIAPKDPIEIGQSLPPPFFEVYKNACVRELHEELYIKSTKLDINRLHFLFTDHHDGEIAPAGRNIEVSGVFLYAFHSETKGFASGDVRFRDEWRSALLNETVKKEWMAKPRTLLDLSTEFDAHPDHFCDALARCLRKMKSDKRVVERIKDLLRQDPS